MLRFPPPFLIGKRGDSDGLVAVYLDEILYIVTGFGAKRFVDADWVGDGLHNDRLYARTATGVVPLLGFRTLAELKRALPAPHAFVSANAGVLVNVAKIKYPDFGVCRLGFLVPRPNHRNTEWIRLSFRATRLLRRMSLRPLRRKRTPSPRIKPRKKPT
jgi:hypothetical protein